MSANAVAIADARHFVVYVIGLFAAVTCTFGNLAAYGQTNMKRLLAVFNNRTRRVPDDGCRCCCCYGGYITAGST